MNVEDLNVGDIVRHRASGERAVVLFIDAERNAVEVSWNFECIPHNRPPNWINPVCLEVAPEIMDSGDRLTEEELNHLMMRAQEVMTYAPRPQPSPDRVMKYSKTSSVPGFKKGTWFANDPLHGWFASPTKPAWTGKEFATWHWGSNGGLYPVQKFHNAYEFLKQFDSVPWDKSCFQTTEDGDE